MKNRLGRLESLLLAYTQMRKLRIVKTGDMAEPLKISPSQERELLKRMARSGLIARVRRGLYLVPSELPIGGVWTPGLALAINTLMDDKKGTYQICGPNTFNRYGYDDQISNRVYLYNNRISGDRTIGSISLTLIRVDDNRLGAVDIVNTPDGNTLVYSSRSRTLLDAVYDWARFNSLPRSYQWIREDLSGGKVNPAELVTVTLKFGNQAAIKRIGYILEDEKVSQLYLKKLERAIRSRTCLIPLIPGRPKKGAGNKRWGVVVNDAE